MAPTGDMATILCPQELLLPGDAQGLQGQHGVVAFRCDWWTSQAPADPSAAKATLAIKTEGLSSGLGWDSLTVPSGQWQSLIACLCWV